MLAHQEGLCHRDVSPDRRPQQRRLRRGVPGLQHAGLGELLPRVLVAAGVGEVAGGRGRLPQQKQDELGVVAQAGVVEGGVALLLWWCVGKGVLLCSEKQKQHRRGTGVFHGGGQRTGVGV